MYALLAGCANLGGSIAQNVGALLLIQLGCTPDGAKDESDKFKNLWIASAIATVLPLVTVLALIRLVPDAHGGEQLLSNADCDATSGSLLKQCLGLEATEREMQEKSESRHPMVGTEAGTSAV